MPRGNLKKMPQLHSCLNFVHHRIFFFLINSLYISNNNTFKQSHLLLLILLSFQFIVALIWAKDAIRFLFFFFVFHLEIVQIVENVYLVKVNNRYTWVGQEDNYIFKKYHEKGVTIC